MSDVKNYPEEGHSHSQGKENIETFGYPIKWTKYQKIAFRIAFVFFVLLSIPFEGKWYTHIFNLDWTNLHYRDLYDICRFSTPDLITVNSESGRFGIAGYADWGIILIASIIAGLIWTFIDSKRKSEPKEYNKLYYWLRVIVRYRAALGIIGFGFTKLLPVQMPYPSLGILNTNFGDFTQQKIFWLSVGSVPWYQIFGGVVEILAGVLLFFRGTTTFGAALLFGTLGAITVVNFGYDGGVHVYASYFVLLAAFLLVYDVRKIYNLLILERVTIPFNYYPTFTQKWQKYGRAIIKAGTIGVFVIWFFYLQLVNFWYDPYKQPSTKGIAELRGNYNVTEFRVNNIVIPYSPFDSVRWRDVTFEKWTSLTYRVNKPVPIDLSNGGGDPQRDINRTFEVSGIGGGRRVFYYDADKNNQVLYLQDKNQPSSSRNIGPGGVWNRGKKKEESKDTIYPENWISKEALANIGDNTYKINSRGVTARRIKAFKNEKEIKSRRKMILKYAVQDGTRIILSGTDENRDSIYVVLDKVDRKYALSEGNLVAGEY